MNKEQVEKEFRIKSPIWTPIIAETVSHLIGLPFLAILYWTKGSSWFHLYYATILGYYIVCSILLSHFFPAVNHPNIHGFFRHIVAAMSGAQLYFFHEELFIRWFHIDSAYLQEAHFLWIVFGFFFAGFDDSFFLGYLTKWMKLDWVRALFWIIIVWIFWLILFYSPLLCNGKAKLDIVRFENVIGVMQWVIMAKLTTNLHLKDWYNSIKWRHVLIRAFVSLSIAVISGIFFAYLWYGISRGIWRDASKAEIWHSVITAGTAPLAPIILVGLYTTNYSGKFKKGKLALVRVLTIIVGTLLCYFFYNGVISQMNVMGDRKLSWLKKDILNYNFTVHNLQLTHFWFNRRVFFVKEVTKEKVDWSDLENTPKKD
eukprot:Anaeramoba_ignava/a614134_24.p1 GENE.a614134_24~~a614134_24.p1  ORF type:complete len:371 (+),score=85.34 a614134_24:110-1222(+)